MSTSGFFGRRLVTGAALGALLAAGAPVLGAPSSVAAAPQRADDESTLRVGVLALAGAISAVGQTPLLATPLPLTSTSAADVLGLDAALASSLQAALQGSDLEAGLAAVEGVTLVDVPAGVTDPDGTAIAFTYERTATADLGLVYDDGDLRLGGDAGAGQVTVSLVSDEDAPFVVAIDEDQPEELLRVALVSQPRLDLVVDVDTADLEPFPARQGFTDVDVTGGRYRIHREREVTLRDPDGRSLLTLEDLRYSTLPDLFRFTSDDDPDDPSDDDRLDVALELSLPQTLDGGTDAERSGTLALSDVPGKVWPDADDVEQAKDGYGAALQEATGLSMADGLTSLAQYTGTVLALQDAADVPFPNLGGGTSDLFSPGDRLLELLSTAASAQVSCGVSPENPPTGTAAPGDTVYCQAATAAGLGTLTDISWNLRDAGEIVASPDTAIGEAPTGLVEVRGSDGEPDLEVTFTASQGGTAPTAGTDAGTELVARTTPRTVQDVVRRIEELGDSDAAAALDSGRLDVDVTISQDTAEAQLALGNASALGNLVGLTGLRSADPEKPGTATTTATGASFDVGFAIETGEPDPEAGRRTFLLPQDTSLLRIDDLGATPPATVTDLPARIGFLGVTADLTALDLGKVGSGPAVELQRVLTAGTEADDPLLVADLLTADGSLDPGQLELASAVTASIAFTATEQPLSLGGSDYATGTDDGATGSTAVSWAPTGLPSVTSDDDYRVLRVFDPVPAAFLAGTADVEAGRAEVRVEVSPLPDGTDLYDALNLAPSADRVEVARRLVGDAVACQTVTVLDATTLACDGLAPDGVAAFADGDAVQLIVDGDPFAVRDAVIEGLSTTLAEIDRTTGDNVTESPALAFDQYASSLPLVDLTPAQLSIERDALREGLAAIDAAAVADEQSKEVSPHPVSSAQELQGSIDDLVGVSSSNEDYRPALAFELGTERLGVVLQASSPLITPQNAATTASVLRAPLRLDDLGTATVPGRGQVLSGSTAAGAATVPVEVDSTTALAITVDRGTGRPAVAEDTSVVSTARTARAGAQLTGHPLQAGVTALAVQAASTADLGVRVSTTYEVDAGTGTGVLETRRTNARTTGRAAQAELVVGTDDTISYAADATDSSGGEGAVQEAPDPMEVRFLAEGLDGLAAALDSALDGAAPRNLGPEGTPVSAPLVGTDLDAGAGVADTLTALTRELRTELRASAVTDADDATDVTGATGDAVVAAVEAVDETDGLAAVDGDDVDVTLTCGDGDDPCTPDDGPTEWHTLTVDVDLRGTLQDGTTTFDTGLADLEVRSDNEVDTTTKWELPVTLQLQRGVGPQVVVDDGDALAIDITASLPSGPFDAIVGYLPARLNADIDAIDEEAGADVDGDGEVATRVVVEPAADDYDLFDLYDGGLVATPDFAAYDADTDPATTPDPSTDTESGITLAFETHPDAEAAGVLGLSGVIDVPWTTADRFEDDITYDEVKLDVGNVVAAIAKPFEVVDPYLAPVRDVVDVLRTPIPVVSDLSELAGGDEVSLLSLLGTLSAATKKPQLELAERVIGFVGGVTEVVGGLGALAQEKVPLEDLEGVGSILSIDPSDVALYEKCTQTVRTSTTTPPSTPGGPSTTTTTKAAPQPCQDDDDLAADQTKPGAAGQTTGANGENRVGTRRVTRNVAQSTRDVTGQLPGFTLPFLNDPDQLMDLLTGEGEASYFRLDFGTLAASVAYTQPFGPIMAGPIPIKPFVGGSITLEGRLAMGFDSYPQTLAARAVAPGDVSALLETYSGTFAGDIIREGFYIDDLDADGVDVPEVSLVTTLEAGAGVSIGIVTAGLKGGITLTIDLDLNDPDDDGRLRTAEIRDVFEDDAACLFEASAAIEAFIAVFVEIELLFTSLSYEFDLLRLGPYPLFSYGCPDVVPTLVVRDGSSLALTSGGRSSLRPGAPDGPDEFEVRQFDKSATRTVYEVSGSGRVQNVEVSFVAGDPEPWKVIVFESGVTTSTTEQDSFSLAQRPTFVADGGEDDDQLAFLAGEEFTSDADGTLTLSASAFDTPVTALTGGPGDDVLSTGDARDTGIDGGLGADSIETGLGDDVATGGADDDIVGGGAGRDDLSGDDGNDRLEGGPGADRLDGQGGDDSLVGGPGRDVRALLVLPRGKTLDDVEQQVELGFDSGDVVVGGPGADTVDGGDGSDVVVGGEAAGLTGAALGTLFQEGSRTVDVLVQGATEADPAVRSSATVTPETAVVPTDDELDGLCASGDPVSAALGADFVTGGDEADVVVGGNGPDVLDGGAGPDELCGRAGDDELSGDGAEEDPSGNDDVIRGGTGDDRADGGPGDDVLYGDDVTLVRDGERVLDGSLGDAGGSSGAGADYLAGGDGDDVVAGGSGPDLLVGGLGDDAVHGEGSDTAATGGAEPLPGERLVACNAVTRVVGGLVDLDGDLVAGAGGDGLTPDTGRMAGLPVTDGVVLAPGSASPFQGLLGGDVVVVAGVIDLDRDGVTIDDADDTGVIDLPSVLGTGDLDGDGDADNTDGDCILAGEGNDDLRGGTGSDYLGAGDGTDLLSGGDGNDLALGDAGTDVLLGGPHSDVLVGGTGDDHLLGGEGDDRLRGNEGADDLVGGTDVSGATDGRDLLIGGREDDVLVAENATLVSETVVEAVTDSAVPWRDDDTVPATVTATDTSDLVFADSALVCGAAPATRYLTLLADDGDDEVPADAEEPAYHDELFGGFGCDVVLGSPGDDLVRGGQDDDVVEAGPGDDLAYGDDGDDVVVGGSTVDPGTDTRFTTERTGGAGVPDGGDGLLGDGGPDGPGGDGDDLVVGDNALPRRLATTSVRPAYEVELFDTATTGTIPSAATAASGDDTIDAGGGNDRAFGQAGDDVVGGSDGDDHLEGNAGDDEVVGGGDDDDVLGGSSAADGRPLGVDGLRLVSAFDPTGAAQADATLLDGADDVSGGAGDDVVLGDNGRLTRPAAPDVPTTRADGTRLRQVLLLDVVLGSDTAVPGVGGDDVVSGGSGRDLAFGQAGDDVLAGGDDDDYLEGNVGNDELDGDDGEDDLVGGGSSRTGEIVTVTGTEVTDRLATPVTVATDPSAAGLADGNDVLRGGDERDVVLGDNGRVTRDGPGTLLLGGASGPHVVRQVAMADVFPGPWAGSDQLYGDGGDDSLYGQQDNTRTRAPQQTYGSARVQGDVLDGGSGDDALLGDQAVEVPTPAARLGAVDRTISDDSRFLREVVRPRGTLVRVVTLTQSTLGGDDLLLGAGGSDSLHAGAGRDVLSAGGGDDVVFGGDGADAQWGGTGHDRLFGGDGGDLLDVKRRTSDPLLWRLAAPVEDTDRLRSTRNGGDLLYGGADPDALQGDVGDAGSSRRTQGDRLVDWSLEVNHFQTCRSGSGRSKVFNQRDSSMIDALRAIALASGSVGSTELAVPGAERLTSYPRPGSFRCENR